MARRHDAVDPAARADGMLARIAAETKQIEDLTAEYNASVSRLKAEYEARLVPLKQSVLYTERDLAALMRAARAELFDGRDTVSLPHGVLYRSIVERVTIPRDALARCESLGFLDGIKIAKSLNREAVERWPDERLILIGAERKTREEFSYDLKPSEGL